MFVGRGSARTSDFPLLDCCALRAPIKKRREQNRRGYDAWCLVISSLRDEHNLLFLKHCHGMASLQGWTLTSRPWHPGVHLLVYTTRGSSMKRP
jgi:hypothetical protein